MKVIEASNKAIQINLRSIVDLISLNKYMLQAYFFRLIYSRAVPINWLKLYITLKRSDVLIFFVQLKE